MSTNLLKTSVLGGALIVAVVGLGWYLFHPTKLEPVMPGSISGMLSYPSDFLPAQRVCAEPLRAGEPVCVDVQESNTVVPFHIQAVPPGDYYVYAILQNPADMGLEETTVYRAYYNEFVRCGLAVQCKDTTKIVVQVQSGAQTSDVRPQDWYHQ